MNGQPWQRMEDVINYEAIVKSIHCYVRLEMRRSTMWIMEYFKKIIHSENSHSFFLHTYAFLIHTQVFTEPI